MAIGIPSLRIVEFTRCNAEGVAAEAAQLFSEHGSPEEVDVGHGSQLEGRSELPLELSHLELQFLHSS